jgi:hypothetical protein
MGCFPKTKNEWKYVYDIEDLEMEREAKHIKYSNLILEEMEMRYAISQDPRDLKALNIYKKNESIRRTKYVERLLNNSK